MKKLLYIGHSFHNKTNSTKFLLDLFTTKYEVTKFDYDPYNDTFEKLKELSGKSYDVVVLFQIMPSISLLKKIISYKHIAFFPMYDDTRNLNNSLWYEYRECNIINFSKTLHKKCMDYGFSSYYIQYFPEPMEVKDWGDESSIFFWQRINKINPNVIKKIINPMKVSKFYLHNVPDPKNKMYYPSKEWDGKVEYSTWFESRQELLAYIQKAAIYIAPREYEGFGNSYLDAMACGRCVIALNNPAMNEYITHGKNGFLYSLDKLEELNLKDIRKIQQNTINYVKKGREHWINKKSNILHWITNEVVVNEIVLRDKYYPKQKFFERIFSIKNDSDKRHKIITVLGFRIKIKRGKNV